MYRKQSDSLKRQKSFLLRDIDMSTEKCSTHIQSATSDPVKGANEVIVTPGKMPWRH